MVRIKPILTNSYNIKTNLALKIVIASIMISIQNSLFNLLIILRNNSMLYLKKVLKWSNIYYF